MKPHYDIFISYRRTDGKDIARALKESLAARGYSVFLDYDALQDGVFDRRILEAIDSAPIYILLLTEHCLDRCVNENDWVRQELEHALSHNKQIVPLVPDKQFTSFPANTPEFIRKGLGQHQYSALDTGQLYLASIEQLDKQRLQPVLRKRRWRIWCPIVTAMLLIAAISVLFYQRWQRSLPETYYQSALNYSAIGEPTYCQDSALYWFNLAAELGHPAAQRELGVLYRFSTDIASNEDMAFYWLQKAYYSGDSLAPALLGACFEQGVGIPVDHAEAVKLYREGIDLGDPNALYRMGMCLKDGIGMKRDFVEGIRLVAEAAAMGNRLAQNLIGDESMWIFSPHADSVRHQSAQLRALQLTDSSTVAYLRWTNNRYFGGWMQISPDAYVEDVQTGIRYRVAGLADAKFAPDTTSVEFGLSHDFALIFPALPQEIATINLCESDTSLWQWFGIRINR